jgi:hypothetical protein
MQVSGGTMKAIGSTIWFVPKVIGHGIRRVFSLIHDDDYVREVYGDNPNGLTDDQRLAAGNMAANMIGGQAIGGM